MLNKNLLQTLFSSGVIKSEHIRHALQIGMYNFDLLDKFDKIVYYFVIGIGYFLDQQSIRPNTSSTYIQREKFPATGGITPPHSLPDFDIEAYGLDIFTALMNIYGINPDTLKAHICEGELKEIVNPSSSGSLLYLTSDSTYLIKTVRDYDAKFIQQKFLQ